ncbi:peroxide stress protein YaaA [Orbus sturtevantii]|uniref:peroxide stress protein YaaA n=1 Tax=Orbus sturtevantii TaxID=3074109 RepID=UPI00370DA045
MITVISPAKTLDYDTPVSLAEHTTPALIDCTQKLIKSCKRLTTKEIADLMNISPKLAELNYQRFQNWHPNFSLKNARQAIFAFKGDVYEGLNMEDFNQHEINFAQQHLRILSGLYGLLKPLDLMLPYRLEMGTKLKNGNHTNLYQFWTDIITDQLNQQLAEQNSHLLINLASNEYFKAVNQKKLNANIINPMFLDESKGQYKIISFYAKKARGLMSRYIIKNELNQQNDIQSFDLAGYKFDKHQSINNKWIFVRSEKQAELYKQSQN